MSKRNLKQALALLAATIMMSCAAACDGGTEAETATEMKTIEPPQDGWTKEQLNEVMYLMGEPFSLPCKLEEIEKHFIIK
ncbi:MAG: hypothetical protein IJ446_02330, partial [Oscillospiraceae bacterium]|nr:hypothetical protein [Oscillospiraceae bacterium]